MNILFTANIGGFLIWLWKRYVLNRKQLKLADEIDDTDWRVWLVGAIAIALFIFINLMIIAK